MQQSLKHLGPGNFAIVMGLCGLALAWKRAEPAMGAGAVQAAGGLAALAALLALASVGAAGLLLATWRAARAGQLWVPETVATLQAAP